LDFEKLRPAEPYLNPLDRNWEADAKKLEMTARSWETLARICHLQTKAVKSINENQYCAKCGVGYGPSYPITSNFLCQCRLLAMVDEHFREELGSLKENLEHDEPPLPLCDMHANATPDMSLFDKNDDIVDTPAFPSSIRKQKKKRPSGCTSFG
jgi:hypothetical protein